MKFKFNPVTLLTTLLIISSISCHACYFQSATYEDIRRFGGFHSSFLDRVSSIEPASVDDDLTEGEKEGLLTSEKLGKVTALYLPQQGLNDEFIRRLCENPSLKRLVRLDISGNPAITNASLDSLLNSDIGSLRDLPQVSGRYGIPSCTIYVDAERTGIISAVESQEDVAGNVIIRKRFDFAISYRHPATGIPTYHDVDGAVKFVECTYK